MKLTRIGNLVAALAHPKDDHRQNDLEDEAHDLLRELGAELTRLSRELDTERSRFAFYAERAEELYVELDRRAASDWGHLRYQVVGFLADAVKQFRAYAAGQPSPSNWRKRAEAAEAELLRLSRVEQVLRTLIVKWREETAAVGPMEDYFADGVDRCADELDAALSASPEAQPEESTNAG